MGVRVQYASSDAACTKYRLNMSGGKVFIPVLSSHTLYRLGEMD